MGDLTTFEAGELFTLRVYKALGARPDLVWANTYELRATDSGAGSGGAATVRDITEFVASWEARFHCTDVQFVRGVFSTYVPDGEPYNPASFVSVPLPTVKGLKTYNSDPAALQVCFRARREVEFGRTGTALYRRVLQEGDLGSPGGDYTLSTGTFDALDALLQGAPGGGTFAGELDNRGVELVMAKGGGPGAGVLARRVIAMRAGGVTVKKYNNRYFDRVNA